MEFSYDPRYNIAYLSLRAEGPIEVEAIRISDEVVVDMAPDGTAYGIELSDANEQLVGQNGSEPVVLNSATGDRSALTLTGLSAD